MANRRIRQVIAALAALTAVSIAAAEEARFTVHPQRALVLAPADITVADVPLAQVIATTRAVDNQTLASGLRVTVATYKAPLRNCPVIDHDVDDECVSLLISAWVDLANNTQYALWHVDAPRAMWALAPTQPKADSKATEYDRVLLACEPPEEIRSAQQTLQLNDVLMHGTPYRLHVRAHFVPDRAGAPEHHVEYEATLDRLNDDVFGGKKYSCTGELMP
jgi:hypothetical protein